MSNGPRYVPRIAQRFGTKAQDPDNPGRFLPGEFNQDGLPFGTQRVPGPSALDNFQAGKGAANLTRFQSWSQPGAAQPAQGAGVGSRTGTPLPAPVGASGPSVAAPVSRGVAMGGAGQDVHSPLMVSQRAPAPPQWHAPASALLSHPDDRALLMAARARDAAARQPEAISIPAGDPDARAFWGKRSTPEPGAVATDRMVNPSVVAAAGTGQVLRTPFGLAHSSMARPGMTQTPAVWSNTGVAHAPSAPQALPAGVTASAQMRNDAPLSQPMPVTPSPHETAFANQESPSAPTAAPRIAAPLPKGITDFPPPGMPGGRYGGTGEMPIPGRPVLSHPPTAESTAIAQSLRPAPQPYKPSWRWPFSSEPAPDFPPADKQGGRFGGTGGTDSPLPSSPSWSAATRPKRKATPLMDKVAGGYGS